MNARDGRRHATRTSAAAPASRWLIVIFGLVESLAAGGCSDAVPHGPPVLQQVYWETRGGVQTLVWSSIPTDAAVATMVSPAATQFDLVFDRVIDGSKVEDTVTINGVSRQQPKAMPPVTVSWPDMNAAGAPAFNLAVWYNSIHLPIASLSTTTSYVYGRETPSYPSNTTVSIAIDKNGITSKYGEPIADVPLIAITTEPFSVVINPTPGASSTPSPDDAGAPPPTYVPTNFWVPLQFNNIPVDLETQLPQYVQVRKDGALLNASEYRLQASISDPTMILLQPPGNKVWDSGSQLDVTLTADLPDIYGAVLGAPKTASFIPCLLVGEDAGARICAPPNHAGDGGGVVVDGGAGDASDAADASDAPADASDTSTSPD